MADDGHFHPTIELLPELLEALNWCGRRIAQGLQEVSATPVVVAVTPTINDLATEPLPPA
jgi:hypothetical protein